MDSFSVGGITRLLTAGCSFTKHCWPTWANYLGRHYEWHKNLAVGGSDNANIARSIIKNAKQNDVVVVMWTGYDRLNFFNNDWDYAGCLVGNKEFYANYYSPIERFTTTMDYVQMVDNYSKIKGFECYHFNAFNWFMSELHTQVPRKINEIYNDYSISNSYFEGESLLEFQQQRDEIFEITHKYIKKDTHPTPITHWNYLKQVIAKNIGIDIDNTLESTVLEDQSKVLDGDIA